MDQSSVIFGALIIGFVVFVTMRGELPKYFAVFIGGSSSSGPPGLGSLPSAGGISDLSSLGTMGSFFGSIFG